MDDDAWHLLRIKIREIVKLHGKLSVATNESQITNLNNKILGHREFIRWFCKDWNESDKRQLQKLEEHLKRKIFKDNGGKY
jgi:hypothetical protein